MVHTKPCTSKPFGLPECTVFFLQNHSAIVRHGMTLVPEFAVQFVATRICFPVSLGSERHTVCRQPWHNQPRDLSTSATQLSCLCHWGFTVITLKKCIQTALIRLQQIILKINKTTNTHKSHKKNLNVHECMTSDQNGT